VTHTVKSVFPPSEYIENDASWDTGGLQCSSKSPSWFQGAASHSQKDEDGIKEVVDGREGLVKERRVRGEEGGK